MTDAEWSFELNPPGLHPMAGNVEFFFDFARELYVILDATGNVHRINEALARLGGWEPADCAGQPFANLIAPDDRPAVAAILAENAAAGPGADFTAACLTADETTIPIAWRLSTQPSGMLYLAGVPAAQPAPAPTPAPEPAELPAPVEPAQTEPAVVAAEAPPNLFQTIFEQLPEPWLLASAEGFVDGNQAALALLGLADKEALIGRQLSDLSPSHQADHVASADKFANALARLEQKSQHEFDWLLTGDEGADRPVHIHLSRSAALPDLYLMRLRLAATEPDYATLSSRRVRELGLLAEVAATIARVSDPDQLLDDVVNLTKDLFVLYHAQLFLRSSFGDWLELRAGAGPEGEQLVRQGFRIGVTEHDNIISFAAMMRETVLVSDIQSSEQFRPVAILPESHGEMAIPILVDNELLGVLDLHCLRPDRFAGEEGKVFTSLAVLIGVALQNARNMDEALRSREELARLSARYAEQRRTNVVDRMGQQNQFDYQDPEADEQFQTDFNGRLAEVRQLERPLTLQEQNLGSLTVLDPQADPEDAELIIDAVLTSLSAHLENLRLTAQTEEALGETELLYHVSARLNAATSVSEVLQAVVESGLAHQMTAATLMLLELDEQGQPEYAVVSASWGNSELTTTPIGQRYYLPDLPSSSVWIERKEDAVLIEDIRLDVRVDEATRQFFEQLQVRSMVLLPLNYRGRWIGILTITWAEPHRFESNEQRAYQALTVQMTTAVNNLMLLDESQVRATQLEKLSQAETDLSLANDEDAILLALVRQLPSRWLRKATLSYLDDSGAELMQQLVSHWTPAGFQVTDFSDLTQEVVNPNGLAQLWLQYAGEVLSIADVQSDYRLPPAVKVMAEEEGWAAVTMLPLRSANRWQGVLALYWTTTDELGDDQFFLFDRLMEPISAVVASRRAQLEQQQAEAAERAARRETESLYIASRRINEAQDLENILAATVETAGVTDFNSGIIVIFDEDIRDGELDIQIVANWHSGAGRPPEHVGTHQVIYSPTAAGFLMPDEIVFVHSLQTDPQVPLQVRSNFFGRQGAEACLLLPLLAAGRKLGAMILTSEKPHEFSDREKRVFASLAPQIAIAIQNKSLLEAAQNRARREKILREITAQVRSSNDVDTILQIAAEQVGRAFGRPAFVALESAQKQNE
ncbi:MAG: GAF domain-containing protein [Ardenticatenales bacterium]|nr:GAF domain-containing protein [Ardenticatenales bacterium]